MASSAAPAGRPGSGVVVTFALALLSAIVPEVAVSGQPVPRFSVSLSS